MNRFRDIHSHGAPAEGRVVNVDPSAQCDLPSGPVSVGIHPWRADRADDEALARLDRWARLPETVAIGETGLDSLRGPSIDVQMPLLRRHALLAETVGKPLILHIVKRWDEIIALKKELKPNVKWIIHGFRGGAAQARRLVDAGFYLSIGEKFNPEAVRAIPADRLFTETDESTLPISEIAARLAAISQNPQR